jgi:WXG100 family type VII secretion target
MAGNENVAANYGDLGGVVSKFNAQYNEFEQALAQISSTIQQVGSTWQGQGYQAFEVVSMEWHAKVTSLNNTLSEISNKVNSGSGHYQETDQGVASSFNQVGFGR